ncbi:hypothetical protein P692DRAFT_20387575 [Suillus brevipes Sb2]|nr:hypothetical protein P692DRAFT_20387575 [Suillus brevipes Sb2]
MIVTGNISRSTFGRTSKFLPMRLVYIADIKRTTGSSGLRCNILPTNNALLQPVISWRCCCLHPIQTSGLQSRQDMWVSLLRRVCEPCKTSEENVKR